MPFVNIKTPEASLTSEQKAEISHRLLEILDDDRCPDMHECRCRRTYEIVTGHLIKQDCWDGKLTGIGPFSRI